METDIIPIKSAKGRDDPGPPQPEPLDLVAVLEALLDPTTTPVERATLLARVRAEQERVQSTRPRRDL